MSEAKKDQATEDQDQAKDEVAAEAAAEDADEPEAAAEAAGDEAEPADEPEPERDLEGELSEMRDAMLRAVAEAENVRRRAERDKQEFSKFAIANFARDVLEVADNLARALGSVAAEDREPGGPLDALASGVEMTEKGLLAVLERHGVRKLEPMGAKFDPNFHQAMFEVETAEHPPGTVVQVMQAGYSISDRLLRPAMVGVAKAPASGPDGDDHSPVDTVV